MAFQKGYTPWNKGLTTAWNKGLTKETDQRLTTVSRKVSLAMKGRPRSTPIWNKGLTKENDPRMALLAENLSIATIGHPAWNKDLTKEIDPRLAKLAFRLQEFYKTATTEYKLRYKEISISLKRYYKIHPEKLPIYKHGTRISRGQCALYEYIRKLFPDTKLEFQVITKDAVRFIDIAIPSLYIGFEYDGSYWHQDKNKETKRDNELEEVGWEIIHVPE